MLARAKAVFDRRQTLAGTGAVSNEELGAARAGLAAALVLGTTPATAPDIRAAQAA